MRLSILVLLVLVMAGLLNGAAWCGDPSLEPQVERLMTEVTLGPSGSTTVTALGPIVYVRPIKRAAAIDWSAYTAGTANVQYQILYSVDKKNAPSDWSADTSFTSTISTASTTAGHAVTMPACSAIRLKATNLDSQDVIIRRHDWIGW